MWKTLAEIDIQQRLLSCSSARNNSFRGNSMPQLGLVARTVQRAPKPNSVWNSFGHAFVKFAQFLEIVGYRSTGKLLHFIFRKKN